MKIFGAVWFIKKQNNEIKTKLMGKNIPLVPVRVKVP